MSAMVRTGTATRYLLSAGLCLVPALLLLGAEIVRSRDGIAAAYRGQEALAALRPVIALAAPLAAGDDARALALFQSVDAGRLARDQEFGTDARSRALGNAVRNGNPANKAALREALDLAAEVAVASGAAADPASGEYLALYRRLAAAFSASASLAANLRSAPRQGDLPQALQVQLAADAAELQAAQRALQLLWLTDAGGKLGLLDAVAAFETEGAGGPSMLAALLAQPPLTADTAQRLRQVLADFTAALAALGGRAADAASLRLAARISGLESRAMLVISLAVFSLCAGAAFAVSQSHALAAERQRIDGLRAAALDALRQAESLMALHGDPPPPAAVNAIVTAA